MQPIHTHSGRYPAAWPLVLAALAAVPVLAASYENAGWALARLQADETAFVREAIVEMKGRARGPFERLRWFCADGTILPPEPYACREHGGGRQHGEYTAAAKRLHGLGFHVAPVYAAIDWEEFYDLANSHYFLREVVLQRFLESADNGWVMRQARYYRGGRQAENEEASGRDLLVRLLSNGDWVRSNYLLAAAVVEAVPHGAPGIAGEEIRGLALQVSDADPNFMRLRVKIHSSPGPEDLPAVRAYRASTTGDTPAEARAKLAELEAALAELYATGVDAEAWRRVGSALPGELPEDFRRIGLSLDSWDASTRVANLSDRMKDLRDAAVAAAERGDGSGALAALDALHFARAQLFADANAHVAALLQRPMSRRDHLAITRDLLLAAYGGGWLTEREWQSASQRLATTSAVSTLSRAEYLGLTRYLGRTMEWSTAAAKQMVAIAEQRYSAVEPLAHRFSDDAVRSSVLLPLAQILNGLEGDAASEAGLRYELGDARVSSGVMGLNPGAALGELHLIENPADVRDLDPDGIYILPETPADLGRLAGILTIDQGSRLSHVQLLARGLGIPNAAVAARVLDSLRPFVGQEVLYAVSPLGSVLLKPLDQVSPETLAAFRTESATSAPRVTIDTSTIDLDTQRVLPLESIESVDSGRLAGPKAANLGQLHQLFPNRVAPGLVIPFGIFRAHIDRDLDGNGQTLYEETVAIYNSGRTGPEMARELAAIADKIRAMPLLPRFERELLAAIRSQFELRDVTGVFVRSDTNVEDLPGFSGAGLNLTVMNVVGEDALLQAVRDVWASPYRLRSYEWRQRVVTNPEAVYPSIVLLGSVAAEASGVLVTRDIDGALMGTELDPEDAWTATVAAGVGGAVEGESTETLLLPGTPGAFDPVLLASARAAWRKTLDPAGGIRDLPVFGDLTLLTEPRLRDLNEVVAQIQRRYPDAAGSTPWDIEFGFVGDETVLFQIRPFVIGGSTLAELAAMDEQMLAGAAMTVPLDGKPR